MQQTGEGEELIQAHLNNPYQILKRKATSKFNQIILTHGDWNQRDQNTFCKIKPNQEDMQMLKSIATELITSDPKTQPTQFLWEANYAIHSVAKTWKTKHQKTRIIQQNQNKFKPKWMKHIESQMNLLGREISQITQEIKRLKTNGRITRKVRRNGKWTRQELKGELSIKALLILKEKKISMIRTLKYRKQKKIERFEKQQFNKLFDNSQEKVYDKFRDILSEDRDNDQPLYKTRQTSKTRGNYKRGS